MAVHNRREAIPGPRANPAAAAGAKRLIRWDQFYTLFILIILCTIWFIAGNRSTNQITLPTFQSVVLAFWEAVTSPRILGNLLITLRRVGIGFGYAFLIGAPVGLLMGYSDAANRALAPFINSARQVPVMAWVPLSIIWFGLGDGPTVF